MDKNKYLLLLTIFIFIVSGCSKEESVQLQGVAQSSDRLTELPQSNSDEESDSDSNKCPTASVTVSKEQSMQTVAIYVCGAVLNTGVYELPLNARIDDAVRAAGGMLQNAQADGLNLAKNIEDGQMIRVPYIGENTGASIGIAETQETDDKININDADVGQLTTIPGIGDSKADSIIRYREKNGGFKSIEDIMNIEGIKEGVFQKIKDYICVK